MEPNSTAWLMCFLRNISIMHIPMPLGKGELMRITTGSFVDGYLKELRKRLPKKSHSSKIGLTTILILFENQIQTTSTSPCRTQVQPAASFLVCSLIFIEYKIWRGQRLPSPYFSFSSTHYS